MIEVGDLRLKVLHAPGHFEESTMAWEREHNPYIKFEIKEAKAEDPGAG